MAGNKVQTTFSADDREIIRSMLKQQKEITKIQQKLLGAGKAGARAGKQTNSTFGQATATLKTFGTAIVGVGSVVAAVQAVTAQIRREIENIRSRQRGAATEQLDFQRSLTQATRNAIGIFTAEEVRSRSLKLAQQAGVTPAKAAGVIGSAVTSVGVTNKQQAELAIQAATAALQFAPDLDSAGVEALAGVSGSIAKRFGIKPSAAIGFVQRVGTKANVRELEPLIKNVAPVVSNLTQFGFKPSEAGALVSTLTQGTGDVTGELSGTAAINLADSLTKIVKKLPKRFGGLQVNQAGAIVDQAGDVAAGRALEILKNDPELKDVFFEGGRLDGASIAKANLGKGKAKPTIRGILTPGTVAQRDFEAFKQGIGGFAEGQKTFDDFIKDIKSVTLESQLHRAFQSSISQLKILDQAGGITSITREGVQQSLKAAGVSEIEQRIEGLLFEAGGGLSDKVPIKRVMRVLRREAKDLAEGVPTQAVSAGVGGRGVLIGGRPATEEEKQSAKVLNRLADTLEKLSVSLQNQQPNQALKVEVVKQPKPQPITKPQVTKPRRGRALSRDQK